MNAAYVEKLRKELERATSQVISSLDAIRREAKKAAAAYALMESVMRRVFDANAEFGPVEEEVVDLRHPGGPGDERR